MTRTSGLDKNLQRAIVFLDAKDYLQAKRSLEEIVRGHPEKYSAYSLLAKIEYELAKKGDTEKHLAREAELIKKAEAERQRAARAAKETIAESPEEKTEFLLIKAGESQTQGTQEAQTTNNAERSL